MSRHHSGLSGYNSYAVVEEGQEEIEGAGEVLPAHEGTETSLRGTPDPTLLPGTPAGSVPGVRLARNVPAAGPPRVGHEQDQDTLPEHPEQRYLHEGARFGQDHPRTCQQVYVRSCRNIIQVSEFAHGTKLVLLIERVDEYQIAHLAQESRDQRPLTQPPDPISFQQQKKMETEEEKELKKQVSDLMAIPSLFSPKDSFKDMVHEFTSFEEKGKI